jgi:mono/diheme cytochrome c family protein
VIRAVGVGAAVAAAMFALIAAVAGIDGDAGDEREAASAAAATADAAGRAPTRAEIAVGRELFARMGCGSCHSLAAAGSRGQIGPDLAGIGDHTRSSLVATIVNPPEKAGFNPMPRDFGSRMSAEELDALAAFLIAARDG